jgi:3-hydroxyacyl-[acyl-carrier-protein] dehydratase
MKFNLLDKVESISATRLVATKHVSLAEEYLADHFPTFPVLPGVMMLEALTQGAGWVMHLRSDFAKSFSVLKEARNVKYGNFVAPGNHLRVDVEWMKETPGGAAFKASGTVDGSTAVTARIEIAYFNLGEKRPELGGLDARLIEHHRRRWALIAPSASEVGVSLATGN